ncbi:NAD-dependent epimerase/dehydratase family protein [Bradyrhizobium sp.]|uniref:NAD-dependent epimerase/dehydratase family protein n=1 Tax=Bradyrhizobium sp. TaxID=376 RepID=UPI001D77D27D|nr:NAD(P)-dependent oxidoreductase [Bradyrhizobium sp.]MBV8700507.1 NAD(P)-dependent oxidoreductase [Bradyrhizobium sp.]MBV8921351.1 NAD(P)-dependent oxidoreductase [Bradyrhizobium sp.]MBV9984812.1 NAD(P)-dependent oxidoreductase [Bradyrhizobium sp.]
MKILVTGASGFAGSVAAREFALAGHAVSGLYRSRTRFLATLDGVENVTLACGDLAAAADLPGPFDAVVHTAATSPAPGVDTQTMVHDNVVGTRALIEAALRWGTRAFVLYSSLSLYGVVATPVVDETTPMIDADAYGATKLLGELMLKDTADRLPGLALRLPGVVGPGAHRNWLSSVAAKLTRGDTVDAFHLDRPFNNAAHVADISALARRAIERSWSGFDAVVLGARGAVTVREALTRLAAGLGVPARLEGISSPKASFILSSERAIARWGYDPMEIGALIDRYAGEVRAWSSAAA